MKKIYLFLFVALIAITSNAQDKVVLRQTFIKVKPGNNYAEDLKTKFGEMAQKRIDAGYQLGWHLWEVVGNPQAPFTHIIVEPMMISQMEKERTREGWLKLRKDAIPSMTDSDWTTFMENVRDKRDIVAEAMFVTVTEVKMSPDLKEAAKDGLMVFKEGKFKRHNSCRNPNNTEGAPWCYTTNPKVRWQYCAIQDNTSRNKYYVLFFIFIMIIILSIFLVKLIFKYEILSKIVSSITGGNLTSQSVSDTMGTPTPGLK